MADPLISQLAICPDIPPPGEEAYQFQSEISIAPLTQENSTSAFRADAYLSEAETQYRIPFYSHTHSWWNQQWSLQWSPNAEAFLRAIPSDKKSLVCVPKDWQLGQPLGLKKEALAVFQKQAEFSAENPATQPLSLVQLDPQLSRHPAFADFLKRGVSYRDFSNPQLNFKEVWSEFPLTLSQDEAFAFDQILKELHSSIFKGEWIAPLKDSPKAQPLKFLFSNYLRETDLRFLRYQIQTRYLDPQQKRILALKTEIARLEQWPNPANETRLLQLDVELDQLERGRFRLLALMIQLEKTATQREQAAQSGTAVMTDREGKSITLPNTTLSALSGNDIKVLARPFSLELKGSAQTPKLPSFASPTPQLENAGSADFELLGHFFEEDIQWLAQKIRFDPALLFRRVPDSASTFKAGTYSIVKDYDQVKKFYDALKTWANDPQNISQLSAQAKLDIEALVKSSESILNKLEGLKVLSDSKLSTLGYVGIFIGGALITGFWMPGGDWLRRRFFSGVSRLIRPSSTPTETVSQPRPASPTPQNLPSGQRALPPAANEAVPSEAAPNASSKTSPAKPMNSGLSLFTGAATVVAIVSTYFQYQESQQIEASDLPSYTKAVAKARPMETGALALDLAWLFLTGSKLAAKALGPIGLIVTEFEAQHRYNLSASQNPHYSPAAREAAAPADTSNKWIMRTGGVLAVGTGAVLAVVSAPVWIIGGGTLLVGGTFERIASHRNTINDGRAWADSVVEKLEEQIQLKKNGKTIDPEALEGLVANPNVDEEAVFELLTRLRDKDLLKELDWAHDPQLTKLREACYAGLKRESESWSEWFGNGGAPALLYFGMQSSDQNTREEAKAIYLDEVGDAEGPLVDFYEDFKIPEAHRLDVAREEIEEFVSELTGAE